MAGRREPERAALRQVGDGARCAVAREVAGCRQHAQVAGAEFPCIERGVGQRADANGDAALWALTLSAFVIVGPIPTIAASLNVDVPSAGLLVSLYAPGVAIGAPVLTALAGRIPRKQLLLGLMALFTIGNLVRGRRPATAH